MDAVATSSISEFIRAPGYALYQNPDYMMEVEKDIDSTMYLRMTFSNNKMSFWKMLLMHAQRCFGSGDLRASTAQFASAWDEMRYDCAPELGSKFSVLLTNDYASGAISIEAHLPYCEVGLLRFARWEPSEARFIDELRDIVRATVAAQDVASVYQPGTLLGDY